MSLCCLQTILQAAPHRTVQFHMTKKVGQTALAAGRKEKLGKGRTRPNMKSHPEKDLAHPCRAAPTFMCNMVTLSEGLWVRQRTAGSAAPGCISHHIYLSRCFNSSIVNRDSSQQVRISKSTTAKHAQREQNVVAKGSRPEEPTQNPVVVARLAKCLAPPLLE
eukprot:1195855-Prorocentrum_minimum.AAC.6